MKTNSTECWFFLTFSAGFVLFFHIIIIIIYLFSFEKKQDKKFATQAAHATIVVWT